MNKFFYYNSSCSGSNTPSIFSIDPYVTAMKELFLTELKQVVYYIEKLRDLNFDMTIYTDKVIEFITVLIVNLDFTKENTFTIIEDLYENKKMLEKMYISACEKSDIDIEIYPSETDNLSSRTVILKALNEKEKNIKYDFTNKQTTKTRKYLYEIMVNIVLNTCNNLIELKSYGISFDEAKNQVLKFFNRTNTPDLTIDDLKETIKNFSKTSYETTKNLYNTLMNRFGPISRTKVNVCEREGKSILVLGSGYDELEKILSAVKGLNIYIYSYHEMISAFQYEKFSKHPNFAGHYNKSTNNIQTDFASFPGPVFVTRNSLPKIDVIRGRIYTSTKYPAFGISKIENNNFEPLIQSALDTEGFCRDNIFNTLEIGYNHSEIDQYISDIIQKFNDNEIRKVIIIGLADRFNSSNKYIDEFLNLNHDGNYVLSFAYETKHTNIQNVNSYLDFGILYEILEKLIQKNEKIKDIVSIFLIDCNNTTISHIFNIIHLGIKNIFLGECCPNVVSPVLLDGLEEMFNVNLLTTAQKDIKKLA